MGPTLASVTGEIDAFESSMQVVPRLGNFWMPDEGRSEHLCQFVARVSGASPCAASVIDCALRAAQVPVNLRCPLNESAREASGTRGRTVPPSPTEQNTMALASSVE